MNGPGFNPHHLDPGAQEFFPMTTLPPPPPLIYYPYPPPPPFPPPPAHVSVAPEPPPPIPASLPPSTTTPTRALLLTMVPTTVSESTVRRELEIFGDVRAVQMERRREGLVTVHFYDVREAQAALVAIQEQHMQQQFRLGQHYAAVMKNYIPVTPLPLPPPAAPGLISGRVVWAQFVIPVTSRLVDGNNQGTIVLFNLEHGVSASYLRNIFQTFGPVKELRETPNKTYQRFIEFYDVRDAAMAMAGMNGKEIYGKPVVIEFSRPGGQCNKLFKTPQNHSPRSNNNIFSTRAPQPPRTGGSGPARVDLRARGNPSGSCTSGSSSFHDDQCMSVVGPKKKNGSKKTSPNSISGGGSKQAGQGVGRPWKGGGGGARHGGTKDDDPWFLINEEAILDLNCRDLRTTVMIKNIPNKYSQKLVLNMLDNHCINCNEQIEESGDDQPLSSYDFLYLPIDFINKCNVGYGFVNMTSPEATLRLYKAFHHQNWEVFNSRKICQVTYARLQGVEALREHFKTSKFPGDAEEYMPVVFSPPRDGRQLSEPMPIVGRAADSPSSSPASSSKENQSEPQLALEEVNGDMAKMTMSEQKP